MNPLVEDCRRRRQLLRQVHDAGILPCPRVGRQQQAERLLALVLPEVFSVRFQLVGIVLRIDRSPRD